mmetsp:Transcript_32050/g.52941  ORF Transcript_32050/g.52941 Transcript_32050/m.52941 type:complete len:204 (-) Transcript_32050:957-1568(-)
MCCTPASLSSPISSSLSVSTASSSRSVWLPSCCTPVRVDSSPDTCSPVNSLPAARPALRSLAGVEEPSPTMLATVRGLWRTFSRRGVCQMLRNLIAASSKKRVRRPPDTNGRPLLRPDGRMVLSPLPGTAPRSSVVCGVLCPDTGASRDPAAVLPPTVAGPMPGSRPLCSLGEALSAAASECKLVQPPGTLTRHSRAAIALGR